ncbi:HAD domain-containing protein [Cupriavidus sp. YR651]|uniref:HAD domain-containing protein n=1 Tax=Cupriavidus sp. YR651 TaxID=1855315 RepID=UPI0015A06DD9
MSRIVLSTSWQPLEGGYEYEKSRPSKSPNARCMGGTFDRHVTRKAWFESMSRPDQVLLDVCQWIAVDDSPDKWPSWTLSHTVRTDAVLGIAAPSA